MKPWRQLNPLKHRAFWFYVLLPILGWLNLVYDSFWRFLACVLISGASITVAMLMSNKVWGERLFMGGVFFILLPVVSLIFGAILIGIYHQ